MATWYVRPDTSHSGTRNGTSYATAWGGWSEITWGGGGVVGGDTLEVWGAHEYSSATAIGAHGGSSEATRCIIQGKDGASITYSGAGSVYLDVGRNYTTVRDLTIVRGPSSCVVLSATNLTAVTVTNCTINGNGVYSSGASVLVNLFHAVAGAWQTIEVSNCTFTNWRYASGGGAGNGWGISWSPAAAATCTIAGLTITGNTFTSIEAGRSVVGIRATTATNAASKVTQLTITNNTFTNCKGLMIETGHDTTSEIGTWTTAAISNNTITNVNVVAGSSASGTGIVPRSHANAVIENNIGSHINGAGGFINIFRCTNSVIRSNVIDYVTTTTTDGCAILVDNGNSSIIICGNKGSNLFGISSAFASGVGVLILDSSSVTVYGNVFDTVKMGFSIGAGTGSQSASIFNNTVRNITTTSGTAAAFYANASSDLGNCTLKNNIFNGIGYKVYDDTAIGWTGEDNNVFYGFASGTFQHTLGASDFATDPQLDSSYKPGNSALRTAGTYLGGLDYYGKEFQSPPSVGGVQYLGANFSIVARSVTSRSTASRSVRTRTGTTG